MDPAELHCFTVAAAVLDAAVPTSEGPGLSVEEAVGELLAGLTPFEQAALLNWDWAFWRLKYQDMSGEWDTFGFKTARGTGKTRGICQWVLDEIREGRLRNVGVAAQDEGRAVELYATGEDGLVALSPPDCQAVYEPSTLSVKFPNGSRVRFYTPVSPKPVRGENFDAFIADEIVFWPQATQEEMWLAVEFAVRKGRALLVWSTSPKKRHPQVRERLRRHAESPERNRLVEASSYDNWYLPQKVLDAWERKYGGTQAGREELLGEYLDEADGALFKQEWINRARRAAPLRWKRKVIGVDPAIGENERADRTGLVLAGLGVDEQAYVIHDYSDRYPESGWADKVLEVYVKDECDLVILETNRGGESLRGILQARAEKRHLEVVRVKDDAPTRFVRGTVYLLETRSTSSKGERAAPVGVAYELGRVSHVLGAEQNLQQLEDTMCTYVPDLTSNKNRGRSPDDLDAMVFAVANLLGLETQRPDPSKGTQGLAALNKAAPMPSRLGPALVGGRTRRML